MHSDPSPPPTVTESVRVAILEDHRLVRDSVSAMLEAAGMEVTLRAGDAGRFLGMLGQARPSVAIVDLTLEGDGGLSGTEVLDSLRESYPDIRAIVLSATATPEVVEECFRQ